MYIINATTIVVVVVAVVAVAVGVAVVVVVLILDGCHTPCINSRYRYIWDSS